MMKHVVPIITLRLIGSPLNFTAVIPTSLVISATRKTDVTIPVCGQLKSSMKRQSYAGLAGMNWPFQSI